ncbi:DedA family protein [Exiguobacterium artemiae]
MGNWQTWLELYSYWGVILALLAHFIPTELIMGYAGYLVASNHMSFLLMFGAGLIGFYVSQSILYVLAYYGGERVLSFLKRWLHVNPERMQMVETNLRAYGGWYLLLSPIWKTLFGLMAGILRLRFSTFTLSTLVSFTVWSLFFMTSGYLLQERWTIVATFTIRHLSWIVIVSIVIFLLMRTIIKRRKLKKG